MGVGAHRPQTPRESTRKREWYATNLGNVTFSANFVLSCLTKDYSVIQKGNFPSLSTGKGIPKTIGNCGGQACRIISEYFNTRHVSHLY